MPGVSRLHSFKSFHLYLQRPDSCILLHSGCLHEVGGLFLHPMDYSAVLTIQENTKLLIKLSKYTHQFQLYIMLPFPAFVMVDATMLELPVYPSFTTATSVVFFIGGSLTYSFQ